MCIEIVVSANESRSNPFTRAGYPSPRRSKAADGARPQPVSLVEVSIGGARVMSRSPSRIEVGTWMELDVDGDRGVVVVRRIAEAEDPSLTVYGVSFVMLAAPLRARIDQTIARHLERDRSAEIGPPPRRRVSLARNSARTAM